MPNKGFIPASELKANDQLVSLDYQVLTVVSNKRIEQSMQMYNFEVEDFHTYAVSDERVWVHNKCKPINLPSWKRVKIDMEEVLTGHTKGGSRVMRNSRKDLFYDGMTEKQIEKAIRNAYRYGRRIGSQPPHRVKVSGPFGNKRIEMWVNTKAKEIETAYPKNL